MRSLNTVAWQVLDDIGVDTGLSYLAQMKFQKLTYVDNGVNALSIGGFTNGVRVVDMGKGYQTLANGGVYDNKTCIVKMLNAGGDVILDGEAAGTESVYDEDTAYMMTDMLKGVITSGTGAGLGLGDMPAAGKTGTTNSSKDTWFCGYTKYYTAAVWVGYDTPRAMPDKMQFLGKVPCWYYRCGQGALWVQ